MIGKTLGGYRIIEQVGVGGMASVYKAYDASTDRNVALKILPEYYANDPTFRERFVREAKAIARLEHLHILPIFAYGEQDGLAYLVMRYMPAGTLFDRIKQGPLPLAEASRLLAQIAAALDHAHTNRILHRDVKPSNVALDEQANAYLTDFGIAKMTEGSSSLTGHAVMGTPQYMSPEQCQDAATITPASDQYSLGIILYEMVTGSAPFQAETPVAIILKQLNDPLPPPRTVRPDLPERAEQVIFKALSKSPEDRFKSCAAMAEAFAEAVSGAPERQPTPPEQPRIKIGATATIPQQSQSDLAGATLLSARPDVAQPKRKKFPTWIVALVLVAAIAAAAVFLAPGLMGSTNLGGQPTAAQPAEETQHFEVPGTSDWVDTHITVEAGAILIIMATGKVTPCATGSNDLCIPYSPDGMSGGQTAAGIGDPEAANYPLPNKPIAALVGRFGQGQPFLIGAEVTVEADATSVLYLRVNDYPLENNSGAFSVAVKVTPK